MSLPASRSLIARSSCWNVDLHAGRAGDRAQVRLDPRGARRLRLDRGQEREVGRVERRALEAGVRLRALRAAASRGGRTRRAPGAPCEVAAVPRSPRPPARRSSSSTSALRIASVISVFAGLHLPVRTSDGAIFSNVSGKSMITQPFGSPSTSLPRLGVEGRPASGSTRRSRRPCRRASCTRATKSFFSAVPNASLRAPTLTVAPFPNASTAACASTRPCSVVRRRGSARGSRCP